MVFSFKNQISDGYNGLCARSNKKFVVYFYQPSSAAEKALKLGPHVMKPCHVYSKDPHKIEKDCDFSEAFQFQPKSIN